MSVPTRVTSASPTLPEVLRGDYCIGCGNCAAGSLNAIRMALDAEGFVKPLGVEPTLAAAPEIDRLCPFSDASADEDELAAEQPWGAIPHDSQIGHWASLHAGHVSDERVRFEGGSGGITSWFLAQLLSSGEVDHVIHVKPVDPATDPEGRLFRYAISSDVDALMDGRKSRYYPVDLAGVYDLVMRTEGRFAIVAIPCFAKSIRLMQRENPQVRDRVRFVVGLVCGHLKSRSFGEYLGWLQGVKPPRLKAIDFRVKFPGGDASQYTVAATDGEMVRQGVPLKNYFGITWDLGFMKYNACEYCDDVMAETADIVFGDAWISPFQDSWLGSNVVLARHPTAARIIAAGMTNGQLTLSPVTVDQVITTQRSGLRHRREGLAYRLSLADRAGLWRPRKRFETIVAPIPADRAKVYELRTRLARHTARNFARHRTASSVWRFQLSVSAEVFRYYMAAFGLKRALTQSAPAKWVKQKLAARRAAKSG
ncbi:MAG TPA: Coenzyme F420 hydrogenase/dehydrogenase, beta subunit C-terminal domain [Sphingobium sp.]